MSNDTKPTTVKPTTSSSTQPADVRPASLGTLHTHSLDTSKFSPKPGFTNNGGK